MEQTSIEEELTWEKGRVLFFHALCRGVEIMRLRMALAAALVCLAITVVPACAYTPRVVLDLTGGGAEVQINDRAAVRFKASNGQLTPAQRATITAERLRALVSAGFDPRTLGAKGSNQQARVYAGQNLICVVTTADARAARTTPLALAGSWAANIRRLLMMPGVTLSDKSVLVPMGECRRVYVGGAASGPIYARSVDGAIAVPSVNLDARYVQVTALQMGSTQVEVSVGGERAVFNVTVKKYAGRVPPISFAEVTGRPCPGSLVKYAAEQVVVRGAAIEPGARIEVGCTEGAGSALGAGLNRIVKVAVRISGEGYITYAYKADVEVHNSLMSVDQPRQLFYSNSPERLERYQVLFAGRLQADAPTRVLYHHQNAMGKSVHFVVDITNPTDSPATYRITSCAAGPMVDTVLVGYLATRDFLRDMQSNASVIERVPPKSRLVIVSDTLRHLETSSGVLQIRQTDGSESYVRVAALPPGLDKASVGAVTAASDIASSDMSAHIYPSPEKSIEADYVVGQRWAFISIGKHAIGSHDAQKKLDGNYGVTYDINVKVQNPTAETKKVRVVFNPTAGLASGVFLVDGEMVSTKYAKPPNEFQLASYQVKPGEVRTVRIKTVPVAGSNYPANVVVRS